MGAVITRRRETSAVKTYSLLLNKLRRIFSRIPAVSRKLNNIGHYLGHLVIAFACSLIDMSSNRLTSREYVHQCMAIIKIILIGLHRSSASPWR